MKRHALSPWVKIPNLWIEHGGLKAFTWTKGTGADNAAALMALFPIVHRAEEGHAELTYDQLCLATGLSRAKVSGGLKRLIERSIIERDGRSGFSLVGFDPAMNWAQLPARGLYQHDRIAMFEHFHLRLPAELDALKLYLLFASRRDRATNMAMITYDKIVERTGVNRNNIKRALNVLASAGMTHIETAPSQVSEMGIASGYRLAHLNTRQHMGTTMRGADPLDFVQLGSASDPF